MKIVGNVNIRPGVVVEVANGNAEAKANFAAINARSSAHVFKGISFIAQQAITRQQIPVLANIGTTVVFGIVDGMIQEVAIEVAVAVVVKKSGLGGKTHKGQAIPGCFFAEMAFAVIDVQLVAAAHGFVFPDLTNVDVQSAIAVDIGHGDSG